MPSPTPAVEAIGFDLGETLLTYAGTPLNWSALYPAALAQVASHCQIDPTAAQLTHAGAILSRYNTRLNPRQEEITAAALFREILESWALAPAPHLPTAMAAFFGFFQQRMTPYPEAAATLRQLRERGIRIGVLTDVPYGMPRDFVLHDLAGAGLTALIDVVLTSTDVGWRKPATPASNRSRVN